MKNTNKAFLLEEDINEVIELITYFSNVGDNVNSEFYLKIENKFFHITEKYLNLKEAFATTGRIKTIKKDFLILDEKKLFKLYGCMIGSIEFNPEYFEIKILPDYYVIDENKMLFTQIIRDKKLNKLLNGIS